MFAPPSVWVISDARPRASSTSSPSRFAGRFRAGKVVSHVQPRWTQSEMQCEEAIFWIEQYSPDTRMMGGFQFGAEDEAAVIRILVPHDCNHLEC